MTKIARKIFSRRSATTILLIVLTFSIFAPTLINCSTAAASFATPMHKSVDIFEGRFSPQEVSLIPDQAMDVSLSICPTMDVPDTVVHFIMPADLVRLVKGESTWMGDVEKGETVTLDLSIEADEGVEAYVRADVEASPSGIKYQSSYYLHVVTPMVESGREEGGELRPISSETELPAGSNSESARMLANPESPDPLVPGENIRIYGTFWYVNENGGYSRARYMRYRIMDDDTFGDEVVYSGWTDGNGYFDKVVDNDDGFLQDGRDPYVQLWAIGQYDWETTTSGGSTYYWSTGLLGEDVPDGSEFNIGNQAPTSNNEALQAGDAVWQEADWIWSHTSPNWMRPTRVTIRWPREDWPHCHGDYIDLPAKSTASWNHVTVHHEYAHSVMYTLYGNSWPPGFVGGTHWVYMEDVPTDAYVEGWAEFMQCAVDNNHLNLQGAGQNIETNAWYNVQDTGDMDGLYIEGEVASILWDIHDPTSAADLDYMAWGYNELFNIIKDHYSSISNIGHFWTQWIAHYPDLSTSKGPLSTIYWHYGIDKDYYGPYDGSISINAGALYTTSTSVTLTLSCKDWGSGVAYMRFSNDMGATWSGWYTYSTTKSWTLNPGDGWKWVDVQFKDGKGYVTTTATIYDGIYLDTAPPTGSIIINLGNPTYTTSTSVTLYLTYSDATSGVDQVRYRNDGGVWTSWMAPSATKAWTLNTVDGTRTVYYQIRDKAGWISPTKSDTIILDRLPPTGSIVINSGNPTYTPTASVTLYLTYSDATSGVDKVRYRNDGGVWTSWMAPSATKAWTLTSGDGTKTVYYQIRDKAGWISTTYSDDIILQSPTASIKIWADKAVYNIGETMNVYIRVKNPGPALQVRALIALKLTDGSYYILLDMITTLPAGYDSGDVLWQSFTIPPAPLGNYVWTAALLNPTTSAVISLSTYSWQLVIAPATETASVNLILQTKPE